MRGKLPSENFHRNSDEYDADSTTLHANLRLGTSVLRSRASMGSTVRYSARRVGLCASLAAIWI